MLLKEEEEDKDKEGNSSVSTVLGAPLLLAPPVSLGQWLVVVPGATLTSETHQKLLLLQEGRHHFKTHLRKRWSRLRFHT